MPPTVPVHIAADAAERVEALGMRRQMEQMIQHAIETTPRLRGVRVSLVEDPHFPEKGPWVVIWVHRELAPEATNGAGLLGTWGEWRSAAFAPEVCWYLKMWPTSGDLNGR